MIIIMLTSLILRTIIYKYYLPKKKNLPQLPWSILWQNMNCVCVGVAAFNGNLTEYFDALRNSKNFTY